MAFQAWLNVAGLFFDLLGIVVFFLGIYVPKKTLAGMIEEVGMVGTVGGGGPDQLMKDRVRQIKIGSIGTVLLVVGFTLQLGGTWPL